MWDCKLDGPVNWRVCFSSNLDNQLGQCFRRRGLSRARSHGHKAGGDGWRGEGRSSVSESRTQERQRKSKTSSRGPAHTLQTAAFPFQF